MKILALMIILSTSLLAQFGSSPVQFVSTSPVGGACGSSYLPLQYVTTTGVLAGCVSGTWAAIGGSGGGVPNPSANNIVVCTGTNCSTSTTVSIVNGTGIVVTNGGGTGGNPTVSADTSVMLSRATNQAGTSTYCRSTTGSDAYECLLTPTLTAYTRGGCLTLDADTANTGTATVKVDTLAAPSILNRTGGALADGDITANRPIQICYDGTSFIIQGDGGGTVPNSLFDTFTTISGTTCNAANNGQVALLTASNYSSARCNGSAWEYVIAGFGVKASVPAAGDYTLVTSMSGTKDSSTGGGIYYHQDTVAGGGGNYVYGAMLKAVPATPYTITAHVRQFIQTATSAFNFMGCGFGWTDGAATTNKIHIGFFMGSGYSGHKWAIAVRHADSFADASGAWDVDGATYPGWGTPMLEWFRLSDTGSTKKIQISTNGVDWRDVYSAASSTNFTPTHYGPMCYQGSQPAMWQVNVTSISEQ